MFGILNDMVGQSAGQCIGETLLHRQLAPGMLALYSFLFALHASRKFDQSVGGFLVAVEQHVLDSLKQCGVELLVNAELAGIHDCHVEPMANAVIEKR